MHESGLSLTYGSLANKAILGDFFGLSTFYKLPIFSSDKQEFNFRVGAGLGYVTKIFNLENNQICKLIQCSHYYHLNCIKEWYICQYNNLQIENDNYLKHLSCPICRAYKID